MTDTIDLKPLSKRSNASAKPVEKKEADEYALLVLKNLHDSLKWMFTILMGGSAFIAGRSLIDWVGFVYAKYAEITFADASFTFFLFFIYALTLFRFYWGWIRYCDIKYIEVPNLIVTYRSRFFAENKLKTYEAALDIAVEYSRLLRVLVDTIPIFFQTTVIFVLAGSLNSVEIFIGTYIFLLAFNSIYLTLNYNLPAYHQIALKLAFGPDLATSVSPRSRIKIWIFNNLICAVTIWALLNAYISVSFLTPQSACVIVMFANCLLDLYLAQRMYSRRVKYLRQAVGKF